jgi:cyclase
LLVFSTTSGNVIASVGEDGVLLIGTPSAASTDEISNVLASRTKASARYVVIWPEDMARSEGDAGWGRRGGFVAMQERALERLGGHVMGPPMPLPSPLKQLGVDRPRVAFSEVLTFDLNGEAIHVVHQRPGYSDADAIAHFHLANLIYLGEVFPGDGYPEIGSQQGGNLDGLLKTLRSWSGGSFRIVPARGSVANGADVKAFHDMILNVRDRVQHSIETGHSEEQIVAEHPSAEFDARWGHGRVSPDTFVQAIYRALHATRSNAK